MAKRNSKNEKQISLSCDKGRTALFLAPREDGKGFELLDYEYDYSRIHAKCGGEYSVEGKSVYGHIEGYADLTRVGYYRVDTKENAFQYPEQIANGVTIMFPYERNKRDKRETLRKNPVVIKFFDSKIIYCGFYTTMNDVLRRILSGERLGKEAQFRTRKFFNTKSKMKESILYILDIYDLFGDGATYSPWEFITSELKAYEVPYPKEKMYQIFGISTCPDGTLVRTTKIGRKLFATKRLKKDPCELVKKPIPGWNLGKTNIMYKFLDKDVYIIGWELAKKAYEKKAKRIARRIGADEAEFSAFVTENFPRKYITDERTVPKLLFQLEKEKQLIQIRKDIVDKVNAHIMSKAEIFMKELCDEKILEIIPDDRILTKEDSIGAGNCRCGTDEFVDRYFPGKTEITAKELKRIYKTKLRRGWERRRYGSYVLDMFRHMALHDLE